MATQTVDFSNIYSVTKDGVVLTELVLDGLTIWNSAHLGMLWQQLGDDIDGEDDADWSGYSVAISSDGTRVAIGGPETDVMSVTGPISSRLAGAVRVFSWTGLFWQEMAGSPITPVNSPWWQDKNTFSQAQTLIDFGASVAMSDDGNTLLIGGPNGKGFFAKFTWNGSSWVHAAYYNNFEFIDVFSDSSNVGKKIRISGDGSTALFIDGGDEKVVWKAPTASMTNIDSLAAIPPSSEQITDHQSDGDINGDGTVVVVGNPAVTRNGFANAGEVRVYDVTATPTQIGPFITGSALDEVIGSGVSINSAGTRIAFGFSGGVRVYDWNGSLWVQAGVDISFPNLRSFRMSSDGNTIVLVSSDDHFSTQRWSGTAWGSVGLDVYAEFAGEFFGSGEAVAINPDGTKCIVGSYLNDGAGANSGSARVYELDPNGVVIPTSPGTTGLFAWADMEEYYVNDLNNIQDAHSTLAKITKTGFTDLVEGGVTGKCLNLVEPNFGTDAYTRFWIDNSNLGLNSDGFTLSFHMKCAWSAEHGYIIQDWNNTAADRLRVLIDSEGTLQITSRVDSSYSNWINQSIPGKIASNTWQHVCLVMRDSTNADPGFLVYINGQLAYQQYTNIPSSWPGVDVNGYVFYLGYAEGVNPGDNTSNHYSGALDDITVWNRPLSPAEVKWLAAGNPYSSL